MLAGVILLVTSLAAGSEQRVRPEAATCPGFQAVLRVSPASVKSGSELKFSLVLKNVSAKPVRLLDIRAGRRSDLALTYYELVFERGREAVALPQAISDPGPIGAADFFTLSPGSAVEVTPSTNAQVSALPTGQYSAYVRISPDPLVPAVCRSARAPFSVKP